MNGNFPVRYKGSEVQNKAREVWMFPITVLSRGPNSHGLNSGPMVSCGKQSSLLNYENNSFPSKYSFLLCRLSRVKKCSS
jgi:hypothetical protein